MTVSLDITEAIAREARPIKRTWFVIYWPAKKAFHKVHRLWTDQFPEATWFVSLESAQGHLRLLRGLYPDERFTIECLETFH